MLMRIQHRSQVLFLLIGILLTGISCQRGNRDIQSLTEVNPFVYGYTSGVISKASAIRVQFAEDAVGKESIGKPASDKLLSISPDVEGELYWEDTRTLRLDPTNPLPPATTFQVTLNVKKAIRNADGENASFAFAFRTKTQYAQSELEGIFYPDERNYSKVLLKGHVYTADIAGSDEFKSLLKASQSNRDLTVHWEHSSDQLMHQFTIEGVARTNDANAVTLKWSRNMLGSGLPQTETILIPALNTFSLLNARVVQGEEQYLLCEFSDPLQADQLLDGLLDLSGYEQNIRFLIESNRVRLYPSSTVQGTYQVIAREGIRNSKNQSLQTQGSYQVEFEAINPQVRLSGNGVIMPRSNGLLFPFEAVGLDAIDVEVFKIYHNNILQFLQENSLDGDYELYRVGRIILQTKLDLKTLNPAAKSNKWSSYALDLAKLIEKDDQAIYSIRIGFRPEYTTLSCLRSVRAQHQANLQPNAKNLEFEEEDPSSIMDNWYGPAGWTNEYQWEKRNDPCYSEYYHAERFVKRNVLASNLGILAKTGGDQTVLAVVTDLRSAQPLSGVSVDIYNYQQQRIGQGTTDGDGVVRIPYRGKPFVLLATKDKERGYLRLSDGESLDVSRYDVAGAEIQKGLKGLLYGERGVWRPGDSVFLNFILDDRSGRLPDNYPIEMEVVNARGQLQEKRSTSRSVGHIYPLHFATSPDAPTGNWQVKVKAGGAVFEKILKIESVKPNRLEIDLQFGDNKVLVRNSQVSGELNAQWLHGAPGSGLRAIVEGKLRPAGSIFPRYPSFSFNDPARPFDQSEPVVLFDGKLDGIGSARILTGALNVEHAPGMLQASIKTRVFEPGGDFSTDNLLLPYSPYSAYAGLEIPKDNYGDPRTEAGRYVPLRLVALNPQGKPLRNRTLRIGIYQVEWRWWWDRYEEDVSNYNTSTHYNAVDRAEVTTDADGIATWTFQPTAQGRYLIRVCDESGGHCSGDYIYVGNPWFDEGDQTQFRAVAAMLSFKADKAKYQVGETATMRIPGGQKGNILVSLENGSRVLQTFWVPSNPGDNTVSFKLTPEMAPNVYAHVSLIQPHGQVANDLPIRLYGIVPIEVEDPGTKLQPTLRMPAVLKPSQPFTVEVREKNGKDMAYTLAVVDEGLLGLTRYQTPDPRETFYAREALGIHTWDVYNQVLGAYSGSLDHVVSIGGDGALDPSALNNTANRFEPVVRHLGPFTLKKGGSARHVIDMPNYVGAVRVMVVAASNGAYGKVEQRAQVRNPLMVLASAPRILAPGDAFQLPINVFANENTIRQVRLTIKETSGRVAVENASTSLSFNGTGNQMAFFPIRVKNSQGIARFQIIASSGGETARQEIEIQVRNPAPYATTVYSEILEPGQSWTPDLRPIGIAGTRSGILEVSGILPLNLGERMEYLLQYPYGCLEQTVSACFPQLFAEKLMALSPKAQQSTDNNIKAGIERIRSFQTAEGGFAYWPGDSEPNQWNSSYAGHFLLEAKAQGFLVPQNVLSDWLKFQKKAARLWDPQLAVYGFGTEESMQLNQAYRLYTLALAGQPDLASMNRLRESKNLKQAARWRLAASYALAGKAQVAKDLIQNQPTKIAAYTELDGTYGSDLRDRALMLESLLLIKDMKRAAQVALLISEELSSASWWSTQSTAQALVAMSRYAGDQNLASELRFNWQMPGSALAQAGSKTPLMQIRLSSAQLQSGRALLKNTGKSKIYARFIYRGQAAPGQEANEANDLNIQLHFRTMDGAALTPEQLPQGKDFIAEVRIAHPGTRPHPFLGLALSQVFPSGWEIINQRMDEMEAGTQSSYDYQDIRDDRVNTFFTLNENQVKVFRVQLNAAYPGKYYLPATACSAMYDQSISAVAKGRWVEVVDARGKRLQ